MVSEEWAEALLEWSVELQGVWTRVAVWRRVWSAGTALTAMRRMQGLRRRLIELARSWACMACRTRQGGGGNSSLRRVAGFSLARTLRGRLNYIFLTPRFLRGLQRRSARRDAED